MPRRIVFLSLALLPALLFVACRPAAPANDRAAHVQFQDDYTGDDMTGPLGPVDQVEGGYASKVSVRPGESLSFHISNNRNGPYALSVYREGATRQLMATIPNVETQSHNCTGKASTGCDWPVATNFTVPGDWPTGVYTVDVPRGSGGKWQILFFVQEKTPGAARILFLTSVNTFHAYNGFGGASLYDFNSVNSVKAQKVSFDRPYAGGGLGNFNRWERHFVEWAEAAGYPIAYAATYDLEFQPNLLEPYDVVIIAGHSEYWTWDMRQRVKAYVAGGGRFMNLSGNTMWWQVRFEDNGRTMVGYKNWREDPDKSRHGSTTVNWNYPIFDTSFLVTGLHWPFGGYPGGNGNGYYVANADHWIFSGTGLAEDELFGRGPTRDTSIHDKESDGLAFNCAPDGSTILGPIVGPGTPGNFTILGVTPVHSEARALDGAAMMGLYTTPGGGAVFSAGTTGWILGLDQPEVDRITRNIIDRFLSGSFPQEPAAADADVVFRDRFNCADLGQNRGTIHISESDVPKLNYIEVQRGVANRLTAACGTSGTGLALKPADGTRYVTNLMADWSGLNGLRTQVQLNLKDLMLVENSTIDLIHHSFDERTDDVPALAAVLQLGRRDGQLVARYQPAGQNQPWIPVPADHFFLLETTWNSQTDRITLSIDGQQRASEALPASATVVNRADLGTIVVSGNASGTICVDELVYDSLADEPPPPPPPPPAAVYYLSFIVAAGWDGPAYDDEDVLRYQTGSGTWAMFFDGSDVGLGAVDVDAFAVLADGSLLLSVDAPLADLAGVGPVADADIVRFVPAGTGANTSGQFTLYLDGSDVGLTAKSEDIDGLAMLPDGRLLISTLGAFNVGAPPQRVKGRGQDVLALTLSQTGADSVGQWAMYFDGSDVALLSAPENVDGVWSAANGALLLSTTGAAAVPGLNFGPADLVSCQGTTGDATSCAFALAWSGSSAGLTTENIDGVDVSP